MTSQKQPSKRGYIVTFRDPQITRSKASSILGVSDVQDGVSIMSTDSDLSAVNACHFEGLGSTFFSSLDEGKVFSFQKNSDVLSVEEDILVTKFVDTRPAIDPMPQPVKEVTQDFSKGYDLGVADTKKKFNEALRGLFDDPIKSRQAESLIPEAKSNTWNVELVKAPQAWARGINGEGVKVAVIDTGIANHTSLTISGGACFVPGIQNYNDDHGHGTHCAGIIGARNNSLGIIGVAPKASLYAVKVLDSNGNGQLSAILAGMAWALQNGMNVVSMSLGSPRGPIVAYSNAITQLIAGGVSVVCASGNSFDKGYPFVGAPANSHDAAIAVGAVDRNKAITSFSCRGTGGTDWNPITVVAPGSWVNSTWPTPVNNFKQEEGTSMAAPHVAGAIALVLQKFPNLTPQEIKAKLKDSAFKLGGPNDGQIFGAGLLDCDALTI